jgi:hypothetical protein
MLRATYLLVIVVALLIAAPAFAQQPLTELETAPFLLAVHPRLTARMLSADAAEALTFAQAMPANIAGIDMLELKWPKSDEACIIAVGQTGAAFGKPQGDSRIVLAVNTAGTGVERLPLDEALTQGMVSRICAWPVAVDPTAELVVLLSISMGSQDSRIIGFTVTPQGKLAMIDTGNAATVYGWFECLDLNNDGSYELVTSRNLDGTLGGLCYHAVRAYDRTTRKYAPQPDVYKEFFQSELAWLDWLLATRDLIQADPQAYASKTSAGALYVAMYQDKQFGFDTLIELPATSTLVPDVPAYNAARRTALGLVRTYRDELKGWLGGGDYPATWKMAR